MDVEFTAGGVCGMADEDLDPVKVSACRIFTQFTLLNPADGTLSPELRIIWQFTSSSLQWHNQMVVSLAQSIGGALTFIVYD